MGVKRCPVRAADSTAYQLSVGTTAAYPARAASLSPTASRRASGPVAPAVLAAERLGHRLDRLRRATPVAGPERRPRVPLVRHVVEVNCVGAGEEFERTRRAAPRHPQGRHERIRACGALVQVARIDQRRIPGGGALGIAARQTCPPGEQRRRLDFAFRVSHQLIDRPLRTLDQRRPLQQRGRGTLGQRFREIARELGLALRERHACSSLHQFRRQTLARSQPVECGFTGIGKAARSQPLLDDRLLETLVAIERGPGSEGMAAKRDVGVRVVLIMLEVGLPLPARTEVREPCASQAARVWRRPVLVQVPGDRRVCTEILRESRDLEVGVEGIGAQRVVVCRRRSRTAPLRRRIGHPEPGANGRVLVGAPARGRRQRGDHQCADPSGHRPECTCAVGSDFQDAVSG